MKKILLTAFIAFTINVLPQVMCIAGKQFETSVFTRDVGIEAVIKATFDVKKFKPENIHLEIPDSTDFDDKKRTLDFFGEVTLDNIKKITYLKDTTNFCITIYYFAIPATHLNNDFAEIKNGNQLIITAVSNVYISTPLIKYRIPKTDSTMSWIHIPFEMIKGEFKKSEILVQRILEDNKDSVIILKNNYPELTDYIIQQAALMKKNDFFNPEAKYFFKLLKYSELLMNAA